MSGRTAARARSPVSFMGLAAVALAFLVSAACASSGAAKNPTRADADRGFKTLEATVTDREHDMPGAGGAGFAGTGNYYLSFEARDGEATAHYRFQVTKGQYDRYPEGSHVQLVIGNHELRDIRPLR